MPAAGHTDTKTEMRDILAVRALDGGGMVHVDIDALRRLADEYEDDVAAKLSAARAALQGARSIEYSNFTAVHIPLAVVYVEAWNFHNRDLESKIDSAGAVRVNLRQTADNWAAAERASTVREDLD
jgi:Excreted virulence factor EspC, type VII ESX diderm